MKRILFFSLCVSIFLTFAMNANAQNPQAVKGAVVDETGRAIIGASVIVEGTYIGTVTNDRGEFSISVPSNGKLVVAYIGYTSQTITPPLTKPIVLKEDNLNLDEVVVVGYVAQKKAHLTGSISTVAPTEISDLASTGLASSLRGMVSGVSVNESSNRPGENASIVIRNGNLSVNAPATSAGLLVPLYVIDDYIAGESAFNNLDPSMIVSITILKDAAAAVYGARSAQGVVLVKTKRGTIGKAKISYSGQFGFADEVYRSKMMDSFNFGKIWIGIRAAVPRSSHYFS